MCRVCKDASCSALRICVLTLSEQYLAIKKKLKIFAEKSVCNIDYTEVTD